MPALKAGTLPVDGAAHRKLTAALATLTLQTPAGAAQSGLARTVAGKRYMFDSNKPLLESITFDPALAGGTSVILRINGADERIAVGQSGWQKGTLNTSAARDAIAASGAWTAEDTYTLKVVRYRTPFVTTYRLRFAGDQLFLTIEQNVGPADARVTELVGRSR